MRENPNEKGIEGFCDFYKAFAKSKNLPNDEKVKTNMRERMLAFAATNFLAISMVKDQGNTLLRYLKSVKLS